MAATTKRIDIHHHFWPRRYMREEQERNAGYKHGGANAARLTGWSAEQALEAMDKHGIDVAIGSVSTPGVWFGDVAAARRLSREWNEEGAKTVAAHPRRFGFFAVVAPPDVDGALREIEHALDTLKADGVGLLSNYAGKMLGDPAFAPVFDELDRRKAVVFIHPTMHPATAGLIPGLLPQGIEFPMDTTRTATSLVLSGTMARCPNLRIVLSHGGGVLPFLAARIDHVAGRVEAFKPNVPNGVEHELKRFYCDTAGSASAPQLDAMLRFYPKGHVLYGSDFPFVAMAEGIEELGHYHLPEEARKAIDRGNALDLLPRLRGG
jgi:predicted TIM-barrel fold metal-dependent hydrolase